MNPIERFWESVLSNRLNTAFMFGHASYSYSWLSDQIHNLFHQFDGIDYGDTVGLVSGSFTPFVISILLYFVQRHCTVALIPDSIKEIPIECNWFVFADHNDCSVTWGGSFAYPSSATKLPSSRHGDIITFVESTTNTMQPIAHDLTRLIAKCANLDVGRNVLNLYPYGHICAVDALLSALFHGKSLFIPDVSGGFLASDSNTNLIDTLFAPATMVNQWPATNSSELTLSHLRHVFIGDDLRHTPEYESVSEKIPRARLIMAYKPDIFGFLCAVSPYPGGWFGLPSCMERRTANDVLWIRPRFEIGIDILGSDDIDSEGWFCTHDVVEIDGEYLRVVAGDENPIKTAGQLVYPEEIEHVIRELPQVQEVAVSAEANDLLGHTLIAHISPSEFCDPDKLRAEVWNHCERRLAPYKIPYKIEINPLPVSHSR